MALVAEDTKKGEDDKKKETPDKPVAFFVMQIALGLGLVVLGVVDAYTPQPVSPFVYGVIGAIAAGPEVMKMIRPGG